MNTNSARPSRIRRIAKSKWSWWSVAIVVVLGVYTLVRIDLAIDRLKYALTPPTLPEYQRLQGDLQSVNEPGWPDEIADQFHHISQGTATIPIPYNWFVALEAPKSSPWLTFLGDEGDFKDEYMLRLGFIAQEPSRLNPDALPIGIAKTKSIYFEGIDRKADAAGFTCSACHTGQLIYGDKRYLVEGGPAMIDLGLFTQALGAALGQTALASNFLIFDGRFDRFAAKVLGSGDNVIARNQLKEELTRTIATLAGRRDVIEVTEGFTRLDALNRIGNQVFNVAMSRPANYSPIDAPVNFPHIWTTSWFNWVQYDGSIMQPLTRNSGEALGVKAYVDTSGPDSQRFASSVDVDNLEKLEKWLSGPHPAQNDNRFGGLSAPAWPDDFPPIDRTLADEGEALYRELCQRCHLPAIRSEDFWSDRYWKKIVYFRDGTRHETPETYLHVKVIPLRAIGTDSAQARVLTDRTVDTTGLRLNTEICTWAADGESSYAEGDHEQSSHRESLTYVPLRDSATSNFGLALGALVERTNEQWFEQNYVPESERASYEGSRPNCLQVDRGYKARPLNGIWATAPFLHNGSVATVYDLLSTDRPVFVQLGSQEFDAGHLGIVQDDDVRSLNESFDESLRRGREPPSYKVTPDYADGLFILDTRQPGNHNTGHLFDDRSADGPNRGRIGRRLSENEKMALIEYLKTL